MSIGCGLIRIAPFSTLVTPCQPPVCLFLVSRFKGMGGRGDMMMRWGCFFVVFGGWVCYFSDPGGGL